MRCLFIILLLAGCASSSGSVNWYRWTNAATAAGLMRLERYPRDASVSSEILARNFRRIAFDVEKDIFGDGYPNPGAAKGPHLRKWQRPIRYWVLSLEEDRELIMRLTVPYLQRLASITGQTFEPWNKDAAGAEHPTLFVFYVPDEKFAELRKHIEDNSDGESDRKASIRIARFIAYWYTARSPCAGQIFESGGDGAAGLPLGAIGGAVVVIRREIPSSLLEACIEEELSQIMGLLNDDPKVRPSIFNDDQEFARLTMHDEYLLRILYDDRLRPGMTPDQAMPIVERIADELLPAG